MSKRQVSPTDPAAETGQNVREPGSGWSYGDGSPKLRAQEPAGQELPQRTPVEIDANNTFGTHGEMYGSASAARSREVWGPALDQIGTLETRSLVEALTGLDGDGHTHEQPMTAAEVNADAHLDDFYDAGQPGDQVKKPARTRTKNTGKKS